VFSVAAVMMLIAAFASLLRGGKYVHQDEPVPVSAGRSDQAGAGA